MATATSPKWRKLWIGEGYNPSIVKEATNASGAYAIREAGSHVVRYVGESSHGVLWKTLVRHFQAPDSFKKQRETGVFTGHPQGFEVALHVTSRGARPRPPGESASAKRRRKAKGRPDESKRIRELRRKGRPFKTKADQRASEAQARWIETLNPTINKDDGLAVVPMKSCPECGGSGWENELMGDSCRTCDGTGRVQVSNPLRVPAEWTGVAAREYQAGYEAAGPLRPSVRLEYKPGTAIPLSGSHAAYDAGHREALRERKGNPPASILDVESSWQALLGEDVSPKISASRANRAKRISAEIRGYYRGEAGARLVTFDGAGEESQDEKELIAWAVKAFGALYTFRQTDRGRLIPGPTAHSSEVAAFWLALIAALPPVYLPLLPRPWVSESDRGVVEGMGAVVLYYSPKGGRPEVVGHSVSERIGERVALLAELTDYAWILKGLGKKPTPAAAVARAELEGDPRERARCIKLASWLGAAFPGAVASKPRREPKPKASERGAAPKRARTAAQSMPAPDAEWWQELPDRSGAFDYVELIRAPGDPERAPRPGKGEPRQDAAPHLTLGRTSAEEWSRRIGAHLADGVPRTLNRIAVEMVGKTADVVATTTFRDGLWLLVERGRVEYTPKSPIFFRAVAAAPKPAPKPEGYGTGERQLRMFNPAEVHYLTCDCPACGRDVRVVGSVDHAMCMLCTKSGCSKSEPRHPGADYDRDTKGNPAALTQLGLLTRLAFVKGRKRVLAWSLRDAPILAYDGAGRLLIVYQGRVRGAASPDEVKEYKRSHWGAAGEGKKLDGGTAVGPFADVGAAVSITYTTQKGSDGALVDYVHEFGEGSMRMTVFPRLVAHTCAKGCGARCAAKDSLALRGGSYRVTERGIVG